MPPPACGLLRRRGLSPANAAGHGCFRVAAAGNKAFDLVSLIDLSISLYEKSSRFIRAYETTLGITGCFFNWDGCYHMTVFRKRAAISGQP